MCNTHERSSGTDYTEEIQSKLSHYSSFNIVGTITSVALEEVTNSATSAPCCESVLSVQESDGISITHVGGLNYQF